ncbi:hypothetical protein [uncultured Tenacibaculum sp.]|uniref:hypothetical protein n=1 Tax=uncultured Tenacibaculum sp. TaxID=174713 RepID=UPI002611241A|nr:hypothetical protein [uncultured Tenacibaculum sp.]
MKKLSVILVLLCLSSCKEFQNQIILEDDFETYRVGQTTFFPWETSGNGTMEIDSLKHVSGNKSLKFISGEGYDNRAFLSFSSEKLMKLDEYYGSLKMFVEEASPNGVHWTMIQTSGKTAQGFHAEVRYGGQHHKCLMANYDTNPIKSDCWDHTKVKIPENEWFVVNWYVNRKTNNMQLWINEELVHDLKEHQSFDKGCLENGNNGEWSFPVFEKVTLGWVDYQKGGGNRKVWIDDVTLSKEKL